MFLEHNISLPFFISFLVVAAGAFGAIALAHHYYKQLRNCKRELDTLKSQSPLDTNLKSPHNSAARKTTNNILSAGDDNA